LLQEARDQFLREATTLARLDHPNLPKVSDFFSIENRDYLVMDFVPGKDLRTLIIEAREANQFLPESDVLDWANQLSDALEHLHNQDPPIVHRDIKPSNLKLTPSGILKLVDFGLVKVLASGEVTITIIQGQGTALYTPLEQYGGDGGHTDIRSDIFSFGATLYHLLTNRPPPDARQRFLNQDSLISIRQINPATSLRTEKAIFVAMSLHPDDRPASVDEFRQNLISGRPITRRSTTAPSNGMLDVFRSSVERNLLYVAISLTVLSLIITLLR
jgi:eukaryotic-like serine/threonine-protein kinase